MQTQVIVVIANFLMVQRYIFIARHHSNVTRDTDIGILPVRLSVRLSRPGIVSKFETAYYAFFSLWQSHHSSFPGTKNLCKIQRRPPPTRALNTSQSINQSEKD